MAAGQFKIIFGLFALALLTASILGAVYFWQNVRKAEAEALSQMEALKGDLPPLPDPGADLFDQAMALLKEGEMDAARNKLSYILKFYDESSRHRDAKQIIGEMNLDLLLSSDPMQGKADYTVRSGDSLLRIASQTDSTVGYIMRVNHMTGITIHPGEQLLVCPLNFTVIVNAGDQTLTLTSGDRFFKEYPIKKVQFPYGMSPPFQTEVSDKLAYIGEKRLQLSDPELQAAAKWIHTKKTGFQIGAHSLEWESTGDTGATGESDATVDAEIFAGVALAEADMEELFTLLRVSTPVKVIR